MRRTLIGTAAVALAVFGGYALWAADRNGSCAAKDAASANASCEAASGQAETASSGKVLGNFDPAMSGCRFACATKLKYDQKDLIPQPGAKTGKLTQCPVSGVVFAVDDKRPDVLVGKDDYVTCCTTCAQKLRKNPGRFVKIWV